MSDELVLYIANRFSVVLPALQDASPAFFWYLLPEERFIYLGDTARLPYGNKSPDTIKKYLTQNIQFLLSHKVKAIVVACNSASSVIEPGEEYPVPLYDVITPSAKKAVELSMDERVGVMATRATVAQKTYVKEMHKVNPHVSVFQQACPLLVPLVEEGMTDDPLTNLVIHRYINPIVQAGVDVIVLGCTHYPALTTSIQKVTGSGIQLVSSADTVSDQVADDIAKGVLPAEGEDATGSHQGGPLVKIFSTDLNSHFELISRQLFDPYPIESFQLVHIY